MVVLFLVGIRFCDRALSVLAVFQQRLAQERAPASQFCQHGKLVVIDESYRGAQHHIA